MSEMGDMGGRFRAAMGGASTATAAADLLCRACVDLLDVDGASISLILDGATRGTFGSSGELSRRLDEFQFTFGEGPCMDAVTNGRPVLVPDLRDPDEKRWPAFREALIGEGVHAVFALPVGLASSPLGALDLFSGRTGQLTQDGLVGGLVAARLAAVPLVKLMLAGLDGDAAGGRDDDVDLLAALQRVQVYQATGMIIAAFDVDPEEALLWLRASAYAQGKTASEVARAIVDRTLLLDDDAFGTRSP